MPAAADQAGQAGQVPGLVADGVEHQPPGPGQGLGRPRTLDLLGDDDLVVGGGVDAGEGEQGGGAVHEQVVGAGDQGLAPALQAVDQVQLPEGVAPVEAAGGQVADDGVELDAPSRAPGG